MSQSSGNKTIAKNTIFLFFRTIFSIVIGLFTSRVVLQKLGVVDFGIYQTVGGVVGMLSFLNGALSSGSSRFLTYEMGAGNFEKLKKTFSSVLTVHILLALIVVVIAETLGLWFVYNRLTFPVDRVDAAVFAYHFSILAAFFTITQVPYNACIIAHEKMGVYAYVSIVEMLLKLVIVYALVIGHYDKLKLYALLFCAVNVCVLLFYRFYCTRKFLESKFRLLLDKSILKEVLSYSGWNLFANTAIALNNQGATILVGMFFSPGVVAARAIANQVNMTAHHLINNFRTAANPQIVKKYAAGDFKGSKFLLLNSTKFSYYLMLTLVLPMTLVAEPLLKLWLGQVPDYSVQFLQLIALTSLFQVFDSSFYTALYAKGRIKENALISPSLGFVTFPVVYVLFRCGFSPIALAWCHFLLYAVLGLIVKPILVIKIVGYKWSDVVSVIKPCFFVSVACSIVPVIIYCSKDALFPNETIQPICLIFISLSSVFVSVWFLGFEASVRSMILSTIKDKINKKIGKH